MDDFTSSVPMPPAPMIAICILSLAERGFTWASKGAAAVAARKCRLVVMLHVTACSRRTRSVGFRLIARGSGGGLRIGGLAFGLRATVGGGLRVRLRFGLGFGLRVGLGFRLRVGLTLLDSPVAALGVIVDVPAGALELQCRRVDQALHFCAALVVDRERFIGELLLQFKYLAAAFTLVLVARHGGS